jgi:hypothetical protein
MERDFFWLLAVLFRKGFGTGPMRKVFDMNAH